MKQIVAISILLAATKVNKFVFGWGPGPRWGSSRRSPRPPSRLGRGHPSPFTSHRRLDSHAFGVRLGALGASLPAFRHFFFFTV